VNLLAVILYGNKQLQDQRPQIMIANDGNLIDMKLQFIADKCREILRPVDAFLIGKFNNYKPFSG
jgi:hypothetical protein